MIEDSERPAAATTARAAHSDINTCYMHHDRTAHTMANVAPVVEHRLEQK